MLKRATTALAVLTAVLLLLPLAASAQTSQTSTLLVKLVSGLSAEQQAAVIARNGGVELSSIPVLRIHVVVVPTADAPTVLAAYQADPQVQAVEVDKRRTSESIPNDPLYSNQWALPLIGWEQVFGVVMPLDSSKVAILDTGIDAVHPDLVGSVVPGTSILDGSDGTTDPSGHGTWLAGIIAAQTNTLPLAGIAGIAYAGVQVMPVTVLNANGEGQDSDVIAGVVWAADHGADVILMAFSAPEFSPNLQDAIDYAWSKGVVVVAAVGNNGVNAATFPAGDRGVMGVAATDASDTLASFSNDGQAVFIAAPGVDIPTTDSNGDYIVISGTSASSAYVAGLAAFMKAVDPLLTNGIIVGRIARNADPAGTQEQTGNGRINVARALADTSTEFVQPAGAAPVGAGGPFVGPYVAAAAAITLTPNFGQSGTSVAVTGNGFDKDATLANITFSGTVGNLATCAVTNKAINPPCSFTVPAGATSGTHTVTAISNHGDNAAAQFGVLVITLSPASSTFGNPTTVTVNGTGFNNNRNISITFNGGSTSCTTTNTGVLNGCSFTTTSTTPANSYDVDVAETSGGNARNGSATFSVNTANQTITFGALTNKTFGDPDFTVSATASSGLAVSFTVGASDNCTISGTSVHITGAGSCTVTAHQAGNAHYNAAPDVPQSFTIATAPQTLTFGTLANKTFGDADFTVSATASSGLAVSFTVGASDNCTIAGATVHLTGAGSCTVTAHQAGDSNYDPAPDVPQSFTIAKAPQTITFGTLANKTFGDADFTVSATASSGLAVSFTVGASDNCTISGATVHLTGAGSCTVTAHQPGDSNYNAAPDVPQSFTIAKAPQTITFRTLANKTFGDGDFAVSATASSGLAVSFTVGASDNCTIAGASVHLTGAGSCTVTAHQTGNADYDPAPDVPQSFTIAKAPQTITVMMPAPATAVYNTSFTVAAAGGSSGNPVTFSSGGVCTNMGATFTMTSGTGLCYVKYDQAGNDNYLAAAQVVEQTTAQKASQTITFGTLANKTFGDGDFAVSATASSGLAVSFTVGASDNCTIAGTSVHLTRAGSCTVTAHEGGNANYNAAPDVARSFSIAKADAIINVPGYILMYDGNPHTSTGTAKGRFNEDLTAGLNLSETTHTNPGIYTDTWTFTDTTGNYNNATGTVTDTIVFSFIGLQSPYAPPSERAFKSKSTIPLKWQYANASNVPMPSPHAAPLVIIKAGACAGLDGSQDIFVEDAGNSGYQYDATTSTWQFNWKTSGLTAGCYTIQILAGQTGQVSGPFKIQLVR